MFLKPSFVMELLSDVFTLDDLNIVRRAQGMKGDGSALLRKWVSRGYCTYDPGWITCKGAQQWFSSLYSHSYIYIPLSK